MIIKISNVIRSMQTIVAIYVIAYLSPTASSGAKLQFLQFGLNAVDSILTSVIVSLVGIQPY